MFCMLDQKIQGTSQRSKVKGHNNYKIDVHVALWDENMYNILDR